MVPVPTSYLNVPVFGSGASNIQPQGSTYAGGFLPGQLFPAEYENWLMNRLTTNSLASQTTSLSLASEIVNILNQASITPDPASTSQLYAALNALYASVSALATEASTRATADTTLQNNINTEATARATADALLAPIASPVFTGNPAAPTQSPGNNSTRLATTAYVESAVSVGGQYLYLTTVVLSGGAGNLSGLVPGLVVIRQPNTNKVAVVAFSIDGIVVISNATAMTLTFGNSTSISITGGSGNQTIYGRVLAVGP
jgi:hypothetical protein